MAGTPEKNVKVTMLEMPLHLHARKAALGYRWRWVDIVEIGIGVAEKLLADEEARKQAAQTAMVQMVSGTRPTQP